MFSTKLSGFLLLAGFPLALSYFIGAPLVAKQLPESMGKGFLVFHEDVNKIAAGGVSGLRYVELGSVKAVQDFFQRTKDDVSRK